MASSIYANKVGHLLCDIYMLIASANFSTLVVVEAFYPVKYKTNKTAGL